MLFTQVRAQLIVTEMEYCDFVVWTENDMHIERVTPDEQFWEVSVNKFFRIGILPELLAKWYTQPATVSSQPRDEEVMEEEEEEEEGRWCYCQVHRERSKLIGCDNRECAIKWFHMDCLKLEVAPKGKWYCPTCWRHRWTRHSSECLMCTGRYFIQQTELVM